MIAIDGWSYGCHQVHAYRPSGIDTGEVYGTKPPIISDLYDSPLHIITVSTRKLNLIAYC